MLSLMNRAYEPTTSIYDQTTYLMSVRYLQSISKDENLVAEKILDLVTSTKTRLQGLSLLEVALQQTPDVYFKGHWLVVLFKVLEEPSSSLPKQLACKVLCMIIKILAKDTAKRSDDVVKCRNFLYPFLLKATYLNSEWHEPGFQLLLTCLRYFPKEFDGYKTQLMDIIVNCLNTTSSVSFESVAEIFGEIPSCMRNRNPELYQESWSKQYLTALNTVHMILNKFLSFLTDDNDRETIVDGVQVFQMEIPPDDFSAHMVKVRQFINLCKCLSKMLSVKSVYPVKVPIKQTLECVCRLFHVQEVCKLNASSFENQMFLSTLTQLQIAALEMLEPLILNFNMNTYKLILSEIMLSALQSSRMSNVSSETISPIRHVVWKLLNLWLEANCLSSYEIIQQQVLVEELLKDINVEEPETNEQPSRGKGKKNIPVKHGFNINVNSNQDIVCAEALKALKKILYNAGTDMTKEMFQDIFSTIVRTSYKILPQRDPPFPYTNEICRKKLYSVVLAIAITSRPEQREILVYCVGILENALRDSSTKVSNFGREANVMNRLLLHPKKPLPLIKSFEDRQKRPEMSSAVAKFPEWSAEDPYVQNIPPPENVSSVSENVNPRITQTFHNASDSEMPASDFLVETHYSETTAENQCNGDDILELPNSSQCQEDVEESDEDEEEEEEDEEEEDINQEMDIQAEHVYIPSTSEMQVINPIHINQETVHENVDEQEYEELAPCGKSQDSELDNSNKNQHNGARSIVPDEEMPSVSTQNVANENGIYVSEDEEMEEEGGDEYEEEEEVTYPAEKRVPVFFEPPSKMPKLETENEVKKDSEEETTDQRSRSPTLLEMKADFCFSEVDDVKS